MFPDVRPILFFIPLEPIGRGSFIDLQGHS